MTPGKKVSSIEKKVFSTEKKSVSVSTMIKTDKTKAVLRKLFLEDDSHRKQNERGLSFKMKGDAS